MEEYQMLITKLESLKYDFPKAFENGNQAAARRIRVTLTALQKQMQETKLKTRHIKPLSKFPPTDK